MRDKILSLIREAGPAFPAEVSSRLGGNSFLMKAYLSELVSEKILMAGRFGLKDGMIYYLPGQESLAEQKANQILSIKRTPSMYSNPSNQKNLSPEMIQKQEKFRQLAMEAERKDIELEKLKAQRMKELEIQRRMEQQRAFEERRRHHESQRQNPSPSMQISRPITPSSSPKSPEPEKISYKEEKEKVSSKKSSQSFIDSAMSFLQSNSIEIIQELESKKNELDLIVEIPALVGKIPFFCRIRDKKKVNDADLSLVHSLALSKNMNGLLITSGSLSKSAQEFLDKTKNFFVKIL